MSRDKDKEARLQEKHQLILANMLRDEANIYCADCTTKGPRWASWNLGVFICIRCAGIHRNLGVHVSRVKSINLDSWTPEQIQSIRTKGNGYAKDLYEYNLPAGFKKPQDDYAAENFIRAKYVRKMYIKTAEDSSKKASSQPPQPAREEEAKPRKTEQAPKASLKPLVSSSHSRSRSDPQVQQPKHVAVTRPAAKPVAKATSQRSSPNPPPVATSTKSVDLLTDQPLAPTTQSSSEPLLLGEAPQAAKAPGTTAVKDSIMSLYNVQPGYTAQGYAVNSYYHQQQQQQQAAAMMAHQQQQQQQQQMRQVAAVQQQMAHLRMKQPQPQPFGQAQPFGQPQSFGQPQPFGGQTLNPQLW